MHPGKEHVSSEDDLVAWLIKYRPRGLSILDFRTQYTFGEFQNHIPPDKFEQCWDSHIQPVSIQRNQVNPEYFYWGGQDTEKIMESVTKPGLVLLKVAYNETSRNDPFVPRPHIYRPAYGFLAAILQNRIAVGDFIGLTVFKMLNGRDILLYEG